MNNLITLTGKQSVCLRTLTSNDLADMTVLANDPDVAKNLRDVFPSP